MRLADVKPFFLSTTNPFAILPTVLTSRMSKNRTFRKFFSIFKRSARKARRDASRASGTAVLGAGLADTAVSGGANDFQVDAGQSFHDDASQASDTAVLGAGLADTAVSGGANDFQVDAGQSFHDDASQASGTAVLGPDLAATDIGVRHNGLQVDAGQSLHSEASQASDTVVLGPGLAATDSGVGDNGLQVDAGQSLHGDASQASDTAVLGPGLAATDSGVSDNGLQVDAGQSLHDDASQASDTAVLGPGLATTDSGVSSNGAQVGTGQSPALVQSAPTEPAGVFSHAHHFTINNSTFIDVHGQGSVNYYDAVPNAVSHAEPLITYKRCPPPTHLFTGRQAILTQMDVYFQNEVGPRHVCVLYGLGGVGKTQIGYKFVETCAQKKRFTDIFFIDATTADTIKVDLVNISLAKHFGKSADDALQSLASQHQEWLLFFNNADDVKLNLSQYLPPCSHGNILITTRNPQLCSHAPRNGRFSVPDLEEEDATDLLLAMAADSNTVTDTVKDQAAAIAKELSCLPLALVQAGAYIRKTQDLEGYLELYRKNRALLWKAQSVQTHDDYKWTVYTTWEMSVKLLQPAAAMFLKVCSFMHHDSISEEMFAASCAAIDDCDDTAALPALRDFLDRFCEPASTDILQVMDEFRRPTRNWNTFYFREIVADLQSYSLINFDRTSRVFYIHPLVHSWMCTMAKNDRSTLVCAQYSVGLSLSLQTDLESIRSRRVLQPHVDAILKHNRDIKPALLERFSLLYYENGRYLEAEKLYLSLVEANTQISGLNSRRTLNSRANLATAYHELGHFDKAEKLQVAVLEARKQVLGEEHPDTLMSIANLAITYRHLGRFDKAEEMQVAVLEARKRVLGEEHPFTLTSTANLASIYWRLGRLDEAERLEVAVLEARQRVLGKEHPVTLISSSNLARTYWDLGRFDEAEELQVTVLETRKRVLGAEHPDTLASTGHLASTYRKRGRLDEAEKMEVAVLEASKRVLGKEHPDTLTSTGNLAKTCWELGRFDEAEKLEMEVLETRKRVLGEEHPDTITSKANLASTYRKLGRLDEAEKLEVAVGEARKHVLVRGS
ncbi:hypothetical protein FPV67DRAFT_1091803 [Lyophyllum atratum]|nr:hypothetical protein FPV67DRAFT_1091803 [Lyophyllum atratum]